MIEDIFPLTREQEAELAKLGVDNLTLIYYQFNRQSQVQLYMLPLLGLGLPEQAMGWSLPRFWIGS